MHTKRITAFVLTVTLLISVFSIGVNALTTVKTQYNYEDANPSWLKDLVVTEQLDVADAAAGKLNLIKANADYPYSETETSFKQNLDYYISLYTLDENSYMAAYLYVLQYLDLFSQATDTSISDEYIRCWLEENGIVYPEKVTPEDLITARTLYALMSANDGSYSVTKGTSLETALTAYAAQLFGVDLSLIQGYSSSDITTIKQYIISACKYTLYLKGYDVSKATTDEEVARLMAIYTIESQGISIDRSNVTFDELKIKYLAAMLGVTYSVTVDSSKLQTAVKNSKVPSYILQLIGKKYGLTLKDSLSFSEMFNQIKTKTDYFNLQDNEFYADIEKYDVQLSYIRDKVWVLPSSIYTSNIDDSVSIYINNEAVKDGYYNRISLDTSKKSQTLTVTVVYINGSSKKTTNYYVTVYQGTQNAPEQTDYISQVLQKSEEQIKNILSDLGTQTTVADIFSNVQFELPQRVLSVMSLLVPSFSGDSNGYDYIKKVFGFADDSDTTVDSSGNQTIETNKISGVGGLESYLAGINSSTESVPFSTELIQLNTTNTASIKYDGVADYTLDIEPTTQNNYNFTDSGNENSSDNVLLGISVIVLAIAVGVTTVTLVLHFNKTDNKVENFGNKNKRNKKRR